MVDKIVIARAVVEQALKALEKADRISGYRNNWAEILCLRAALEQPQVEQEPVAWIENIGGGIGYNPYHDAARKLPDGVRFDLYTHPQNLNCKSNQARLATLWGYEKPQLFRQPLTDEQIVDLVGNCADVAGGWFRYHTFARAIEAAHGIKEQK